MRTTRIQVQIVMKPYHIALFKHFIDGHGMTTPFINLFKNYPLKKNPKSVEEYLKEADEKEVLLYAFYFKTNSRWGYDYWNEKQKRFLEYLDEHKDDAEQDTWYELKGLCKILRNNWDTKHWKQESKFATAQRMGIELPEYLEHIKEEKKDDDEKELVDLETEQGKTISEYLKPEKKSIFGEFDFIDIKPKSHDSRRLKDDEISINTRGDRGRITFNQKLSKEIKDRGGYEYAAIMKNKRGDILIILNDEKGVTVQDGNSRKNGNVSISSKVLVEKIVLYMDITNDYEIVNVKEVEKTSDYVAYLLTKSE